MRVGLVCPYAWNVPGGVQQHVRGLAEALLGLGHQVSVLAPFDDPPDVPASASADGNEDFPDEPYLPGSPYVVSAGRAIRVPYNGSVAPLAFGFRAARRVRRWLRSGDFDVLHVHEPTAPSLSLLACWSAEAPVVATVHTCIGRSRVMGAGSPLLQTALDKIDGRIAVSQAARRTLVRHLGGDAVLIPNGVPTHRFAAAEPLPGWPGGEEVLGFLGRLDERRKGLTVLLDAFRLLAPLRPALRLLLAGPGDSDIVRQRVPAALQSRVTWLGRVSERDKVRAYHSMHVFVAPNLGGESFGIVLAEAMAAGAPIVASDIPAFRDVLRDGQAGDLFETGDPGALADAVCGLLDERARRASLSERAQASARVYDWSIVARDVLRVYEMTGLEVMAAARR